MPAKSPEEICQLFQQNMADGDLDLLLSIYDPEAVFLNRSGEVKQGRQGLRQELAPFAAAKATFKFNIKQIIQSGDIALMHTEWKVFGPQEMSVYAIEVARRQPDGTWCWLIGDPFHGGQVRPFLNPAIAVTSDHGLPGTMQIASRPKRKSDPVESHIRGMLTNTTMWVHKHCAVRQDHRHVET